MRLPCRLLIATPLAGLGLLCGLGCQSTTQTELRRQIDRQQDTLRDQENQLVAQRVTIEQLYKQLQDCRAISPDDLKKIFYPDKLEIMPLSGGEDYDGKPGDDGITVYLRPLDRDGDALKVAGNVRIELYDLQNPSGEKLIGEYVFPVDQIAQYWYGKLWTYHYSLRCPWQHGFPRHNEITIRATFEDFLTQRVITAQTIRTIKPAP